MATPLDPKQIVSFEELLMSQVIQQGSPYPVTHGERDIHKGGVFGDGEGGRSGDEHPFNSGTQREAGQDRTFEGSDKEGGLDGRRVLEVSMK